MLFGAYQSHYSEKSLIQNKVSFPYQTQPYPAPTLAFQLQNSTTQSLAAQSPSTKQTCPSLVVSSHVAAP